MTNVYYISKEEKKRRRDIRQLKMLLQHINAERVREFIHTLTVKRRMTHRKSTGQQVT